MSFVFLVVVLGVGGFLTLNMAREVVEYYRRGKWSMVFVCLGLTAALSVGTVFGVYHSIR